MELNQKFLEEAIEQLEKSYITSIIELIKLPVFVKQIETELKKGNKNKKKQLEGLLDNNKIQETGHRESLDNLEQILEKVYLLRK